MSALQPQIVPPFTKLNPSTTNPTNPEFCESIQLINPMPSSTSWSFAQKLLEMFPEWVSIPNVSGNTPLHIILGTVGFDRSLVIAAAKLGDFSVQNELKENSWHIFAREFARKLTMIEFKNFPKKPTAEQVNQKDSDGMTPFLYLLEYTEVDIALEWLDCGANVNVHHPKSGDTALHMVLDSTNMNRLLAVKSIEKFH